MADEQAFKVFLQHLNDELAELRGRSGTWKLILHGGKDGDIRLEKTTFEHLPAPKRGNSLTPKKNTPTGGL